MFYFFGCFIMATILSVCYARDYDKVTFTLICISLSWLFIIFIIIQELIRVILYIIKPHSFIYYYIDEMFDKKIALYRYAKYHYNKKGIIDKRYVDRFIKIYGGRK